MSKGSLRVHMVVHEDGRRTGKLLRTWSGFFDKPPPAAYGITTDDVLEELEAKLEAMVIEAGDTDTLTRYLWEEDFQTQKVRVDIHPLSSVKKRAVIGKKDIPLHLTYAWCPLKGGGYRVMVPRFGGFFILEDLSLAADVLRQFVGTMLLGENAAWIYDFRNVGDEFVMEWSPPILARQRDHVAEPRVVAPHPELGRVADELVEKASKGKLPPVVGEGGAAWNEVARTRVARGGPSVLLVGPPGAGKSTLVRRLAQTYANFPSDSPSPRIYSTSKDRLIAGMTYLGMWQERCIKIARELGDDGDWLHVGSLHGILEPQHDGATIADFFEPGLVDRSIRMIVECTQEELERARRARPSFVQRFTVIRVDEPTPLETATLGLAYARKKHLDIHPSAMKRLIRHLSALERGVAFPGKALRFVDWLAIQSKDAKGEKKVYPKDVSESYSRYSGVPITLLSDDISASAPDLAQMLKDRVIGQDGACDACGRLLARFKANLADPERPCGTLLFVGPTGVGKTELAKQLARTTFGGEERMIRFDMSEYMLPGAAMRLTAARAGTSSLAARVREQPLSLVLLDEIEKAHPEVFDLLLGILGEGRLTDDAGRFVDFRTTMIVMTSNLGVTDSRPTGFGEASGGDYLRKVRAHFRPELYNRIDYVLAFRSLAPEDVARIVDLELASVAKRTGLLRRELTLAASDSARARLAEQGYHPTRGARPLRRLIEERVMTPIASKIAADPSFKSRKVPILGEDETSAAPFVVRV